MKKFLLTLLKYVAAFGIGGFLIWWSLHDLSKADWVDIKTALLRANYWLLLPVFALLMLSHFLRSLRWRQMLQPIGYNLPVIDLLCGLLIGYFANQFIPRAGEIIRCTVIAKKDKIPAEKLIGTIVVERTIDLVCLFTLSVITFYLEYDHIKTYALDIVTAIGNSFSNNKLVLVVVLVVAVLAVVALFRLFRNRNGNAKIDAVKRIIIGLKDGLLSVRKVQNKALFILYTIAIWLCYALSTWIGCFALEETAGITISSSIALLVFGTFGVIVSPGGLGAYPIAIQRTLLLYGLSSNIGLAAGWLLWLAQFTFTIFFGALAYITLSVRNKNNYEKYSVYTK